MKEEQDRILWLDKPKSTTLVTGFKGIGQVGYLSVKYFIEHLDNIRKIGIYESIYLPPVITVDKNGLSYPIEFYEYNGSFIMMKVEEIPLNDKGQYILKEIVDNLAKIGVKKILAIGGLVSSLKEGKEDKIRIVYNTHWKEYVNYEYTQKDVKIYGPLASVLYYSELKGIPSIAILSYADPDKPVDLRGVYNAIEACGKMLNVTVDLRDLEETINQLEKKLKDMLETEVKSNKEKFMYT